MNKNGSIGLDDVIYCLKKLSGLNEVQPPAFNVTGTWDVKSSFDGQLRLGSGDITMTSDGVVNGFARLTSIVGVSNITGKVSGNKITMTMTALNASMTATGIIGDDGLTVSGQYLSYEQVYIDWTGTKRTYVKHEGHYELDPQTGYLKIKFDNTYPKKVLMLTKSSIDEFKGMITLLLQTESSVGYLQDLGIIDNLDAILNDLVNRPFYTRDAFTNSLSQVLGVFVINQYVAQLQQIATENKLTENVLSILSENGLNSSIIIILEDLKDQPFENFDIFLAALRKKTGDGILAGKENIPGILEPILNFTQTYHIVCPVSITDTKLICSEETTLEWFRESGISGNIFGQWRKFESSKYYIQFNEDTTVVMTEPIEE
ncbi:MAG: hypothetical protein OMM_03683 [Candidatus Magnetoglobus multicellularis str. Araruama]|uniref:Uncharacterized protein n=1 Tax=Candidatus Magnetoglobus multicellularis str. Araruama TaxID=890399 RepID=A0A1V1P4R6_9BACT|nr:MAG: hypothetical protein OMM_03683 [Candidatus Magnetoglobus multicellularis str. Araruama]